MTKSVLSFRAPAWKPLVLASAISSIFVSSALAQSDEIKTLPSVVVTASRIAQSQTEALPHTTVITAEDIRNSRASDVISLLRSEAGIEIVQSGGAGMQTSLFMRGTESRQNLILIDGVPIRDATSIGSAAALEHILPDQIERIEIVRGNVSAIYGSGAIGGVIQIFTKRGAGAPAFNAMAEVGSRGTTKVGGGLSGQSGDTRYALSVSRFSTNGFSAINTAQKASENPDKDGDRNVSVAAAVSHEWSKGNEFGVRIYSYDAKFSHDGGGTTTSIDEGNSKQKTLAAFSKNRILPNWLSTVTVSETEIRRGDTTIGGSYGDNETRFKSTTSMLQWTNEVMLSPGWMATAGIDTNREKADLYTNYGSPSQDLYSRSSTSLYTGVNGKVDAHSLQANLRHDNVVGSGSDTTWYLGYGYALTPSWKLIASTSTAFLAPTMYQLYDPYNGNANLKAERARSNETGVQYAAGNTLIRATLFDSHTRDQINWKSTGAWSGQYFNIDRASNRGFELSAGSRVADIDVRASLTLQNPTDDTTGQALLRRAKTHASLALSKSFGAWRVGGDVQYIGHRLDTSSELPSYVLANLNARYKVSKETSLYARIENLFNREYQTVYGYNQAPRGVFAGIEWRQ